VNYTPDANEMAARYARQEAEKHESSPPASAPMVRGTLTIWLGDPSGNHNFELKGVRLDLSRPGLLIAYFDDGDAQLHVLKPGSTMLFEPDRREGE
jgi:hypothetical protein